MMQGQSVRESRAITGGRTAPDRARVEAVQSFWDTYVYDDVKAARCPAGTREFFAELEAYRRGRLRYLSQVVDFDAFRGQRVLDVGCRIGLDLARFARSGAVVTGVDLSERCIEDARRFFALNGLEGNFHVMDGENLQFEDESFDLVYSHGVVPYTVNAERMVREMRRVLKPGGKFFVMVYNRYSWLRPLSLFSKAKFMHEDAPVFRLYSSRELRGLLSDFSAVDVVPERFPEPTGLHKGTVARLCYNLLVGGFRLLPQRLVRPFGAHLLARALR